MKTASWVIKHRTTGKVMFETFSMRIAGAINKEKYTAVPILDHLASLNQQQAQ